MNPTLHSKYQYCFLVTLPENEIFRYRNKFYKKYLYTFAEINPTSPKSEIGYDFEHADAIVIVKRKKIIESES